MIVGQGISDHINCPFQVAIMLALLVDEDEGDLAMEVLVALDMGQVDMTMAMVVAMVVGAAGDVFFSELVITN